MAQFYLDRDAKSELGFSSTPVTVNGTAGDADRILLRGNAANVTVGPAVEIVDFYGDSSDYAFVNEGGQVAVYRGDVLVASVASNDKGTELRFADGALVMAQDVETGALTVGGQEVTDEKAAYEGEELNPEHTSEAGGGSGPVPGKGQDYVLPGDLGAGNIIASGTGNDTYTTTEVNGLKKEAQIVDASAADNDVLTMTYDRPLQDVSITNVENIDATWMGYSDASLDAENITHSRGANITISNGNAAYSDATVENVQNHHVIAGANVTGTLTVNKADDGARVTVNKAKTVELNNAESGVSVTVNADSNFTLKLDGTDAFFDADRDSVIRINASKDIVVKAGDDAGLMASSQIMANLVSVGEGGVALDAGKLSSGDDISRLDTGITVRMDDPSSAGDATLTVADGQRLELTKATANTITFETWLDPERPDYDDVKDQNLSSLYVDLSAANTYAGFDITSGGAGANSENLGKLYLNVTKDTTISAVKGDAVSGTNDEIPADAFIFTGAGNAIVVDASDAAGASIISDATHTGHLTVGDNATNFADGAAVGGTGGLTVHASAAAAGNKVSVVGGTGKDELIVAADAQLGSIRFAGGDGNDTVTFLSSAVDGATTTVSGGGSTVVLNMGAGDDTVQISEVLDASSDELVASGGTLTIDFGDGKDTLAIIANESGSGTTEGVDFTVSGANVKILGMDVLDLTDMQGSGGFTVAQKTFDSWSFQLKGNGLKVTMLDGDGDFDLSGITTDKAQYDVTIDTYEKLAGNLANGTTLTLNDRLNETLILGKGSKFHTVENFTANKEDTIFFDDGSGSSTSDNIELKAQGGKKIAQVDTDTYATVDAYILSLDRDTTVLNSYAFEYAGDTYVVSLEAATELHQELGDGDYAVKLSGTGYSAADLEASFFVA